ncbi:protodermal factor 1-like [Benincasa hispida]|uniref:protodermal factor 1-like n=1 Tax=Benincasa hispida TaxID=102211 RepID=UPI00190039F2|nr:protodermal factor 1-like [Benincasa hispida]
MRTKQASVLLFTLLAGLLSQSLLIPVFSTSIADQKSYYSPPSDPHSGTPPTGSHSSPIPPSHGYGGSPPHYSTPTPSTPSKPPSSGGGYYNPPSSGGGSPPTTPVDPGTPSTPSTPGVPSTPSTPSIPTTPFTCNYWLNHPGMIWGVLGWWGTLGNAFGATNVPGFGTNLNLLQALSNTRTDGFGALLREGTASYLNSLASNRFPFTTKQVRTSFVSALSSNKAAADQANTFKLANEGKIKPRA